MFKPFSILLLTILISTNLYSQNTPRFKDGETVCFIGNSITQAGTYHMLLQIFHATRFPNNKVKFISCGVSGDNATGMNNRLEQDILVHKPNYTFLMTGMNDMYAELFVPNIKVDEYVVAKRKKTINSYVQLTEKLVGKLVSKNIQPILMTPSIYDQTAKIKTPSYFGKNDALVKCAEHIRTLGKKYNATVVDLNPFMLAINSKAQLKDPSYTIISEDRVHPKETGHFIMAYKIINTLYEPQVISDVVINAKKQSVTQSENSTVNFTSTSKQKSTQFSITSNALPFPIKKNFEEAQQFVPFKKNFNQERLTVKGLKKGVYILKIDGLAVDTLTAKSLNAGINLASNHLTPQYLQAEKVFDLCSEYHQIQNKLRVIALVKYRKLNGYKGNTSLEAQKEYLMAKDEKSKGKPWYDYGVETTKMYFEYLPSEQRLWKKLEQVREKIYQYNIPVKHNYSIEKF